MKKMSSRGDAATRPSGRLRLGLDGDDFRAVCVLMLLYALQGVPMGLSASVGFALQENGASYADQGAFSLASWPFSLKVLWAPIVDAVYVRSFGRRRTWVMPLQAVVGVTLLTLSTTLARSMETADAKSLAKTFFWLYLLLASQDIAVDGWALTMLSEENVGLASTCNAIGQMIGFFTCFTGYMIMNSYGVALDAFVKFWGYAFLASSVVVYATKERPSEDEMSVREAYAQAFSVIRLPAVMKLSAVLLTRFVAFSASETLTTLKLLEKGIPKAHIATMSALMTPLNLAMPMLTRRWTAGERPLDAVTKTWVWRGAACAALAALVYAAPSDAAVNIPYGYYVILFAWLSAYSAFSNAHFIAFMAFYNRVSDANLGGTYMTILNTVSNLGAKWMESATLFAIDLVSDKVCVASNDPRRVLGSCATETLRASCAGKCATNDAPYYVAVAASPFVAWAWLRRARGTIEWLSRAKKTHWRVETTS